MTCKFESLYFGEDGYVVRCKQCGIYQLAFMCICLSLKERAYRAFCKQVKDRYQEADYSFEDHCKCIVIKTGTEGVCFLLTKNEVSAFSKILEEADNEAKAQSLLNLFNKI